MNLQHYKKTPLYLIFVFIIIIGVIGLFSFQDWLNQLSSGIIDNRVKLIIFLISSAVGPSILYFFFQMLDNKWWRYKASNFLIEIPDLNGWYFGCVESIVRAEENKNVRKDCSIEIVQTGSKITVNIYLFESDESHFSVCENLNAILLLDGGQAKIYYIYRNEKDQRKALASPPSSIGTAEIRIATNANRATELYGSYYNQRGNTGIIRATFVDRSLANQFRTPEGHA